MLPSLSPARDWLATALVGVIFLASVGQQPLCAAETDRPSSSTSPNERHPLDEAMKLARACVEEIENNVDDYTATIVKRERVNDKLGDIQYMFAKIRNRKTKDDELQTPFGVYMRFLKPASVKGREVIWVENQNDGKIVAHEAGILGVLTVHLKPEGMVAMIGQRYPITKIGLQRLVEELIEKGEGQRKFGECEVQFIKNAKINKRNCTMIQVVHPRRREHFDFYRARIFIDDELNLPIRYAAWSWPETPGGDPVLLEEYTYVNLELNVGLKDSDFDPDNSDYNYP
ncbi:MAG TPA: DUF1571 domain-containing protein [Pirellulaceae bacterium]|jgi:hypothetical protein|nr:DUF1571 domain-containing protein [Pirellulaceae bacterium]